MSVGTPLQEVPLTGLTSTPRPQVPPSRVFRPLGSRVLSHRPQTSRSITETPFPAQYSLVDICALPVEPGLSPSPLSRGPAPLSSAPCTCLGPGKNPKEQGPLGQCPQLNTKPTRTGRALGQLQHTCSGPLAASFSRSRRRGCLDGPTPPCPP
ncbi:hypothetical protein CapIbe_004182 [Capra ibex]